MFKHLCLLGFVTIFGCSASEKQVTVSPTSTEIETQQLSNPYLIILGNVQDAGSPQLGCTKDCCKDLHNYPDPDRMVVSMGIVNPIDSSLHLIEASPDLPRQVQLLSKELYPTADIQMPSSVFITHAHIGHYTGLMYFGKEAMSAQDIPTYTMPRMTDYLSNHGPWSQLVKNQNISLNRMQPDKAVNLGSDLSITPILVPHRDEYSETAGFLVEGKSKSALFIPDIDKWDRWELDIIEMISKVDYALIDATFYDNAELPNRDMSEIPHPFVVESIERFQHLPASEKSKIYFIHLNHTNPLLDESSQASQTVTESGYHVGRLGIRLAL